MKESTIYPGEYIPSPEVDKLRQESNLSHAGFIAKPLINVNETADAIKVEVALAGIKREDIFIYTQYNIISILVLANKPDQRNIKQEQIHEFDTQSLERHILLPEHADTEFMYAELKQGILFMYVPKSGGESGIMGRQIVVY
jgi:HSP20 family protein